jgi:L-glyceraldehyde 3-phosphate reductase
VEYRQVSDTELRISEIGFGCGGNAGLMVRGSPEEQRQVVARAIELGINYLTTLLTMAMGCAGEPGLGPEGPQGPTGHHFQSGVRQADLGDIAGHVVRSTEESLKRLGVDYLDILQIHNGPAPSLRSWKVASTPSSGSRIIAARWGAGRAYSGCCATANPLPGFHLPWERCVSGPAAA